MKNIIGSDRIIEIICLVLILSIFLYLRLTPIYTGTVPYTYDQGRDFLKAEEVFRYNNLTFIGPTTGIMGLYHGAWWYYVLGIPYLLFSGSPYGFYIFMCAVVTIATLLFYIFLRNTFKTSSFALLFSGLVTVGSYFIPSSFQVSNNYMVPPILLLLTYSAYQYLNTQKKIYIFLTTLAVSFVLEFEVAFGFFIIPATLITALLFKEFRAIIFDKKKIFLAMVGSIIPLVPRLLFEVKNNFMQTHALINFLLKPSTTEPKSLTETFMDRLNIFKGFYTSIFVEQQILPWIVLAIIAGVFIWRHKHIEVKNLKALLFFSTLIILLFILSLSYKNNAFWSNYYEGLPYIFTMILILILSALPAKAIKYGLPFFALIYVLGGFSYLYTKSIHEKKDNSINFKITKETVEYVLSKANPDREFCTKIYTPPIVPYTYNYLFTYESHKQDIHTPSTEFKQDKCFYIIESEPYKFRLEQWRKDNIPKQAKKVNSKQIGSHTIVEEWQLR